MGNRNTRTSVARAPNLTTIPDEMDEDDTGNVSAESDPTEPEPSVDSGLHDGMPGPMSDKERRRRLHEIVCGDFEHGYLGEQIKKGR